jgi:hypothetical protein
VFAPAERNKDLKIPMQAYSKYTARPERANILYSPVNFAILTIWKVWQGNPRHSSQHRASPMVK